MHDYLCSVSLALLYIFVVISSGFWFFCFLCANQEIGGKEHLQNDLFCVVGCKTLTQLVENKFVDFCTVATFCACRSFSDGRVLVTQPHCSTQYCYHNEYHMSLCGRLFSLTGWWLWTMSGECKASCHYQISSTSLWYCHTVRCVLHLVIPQKMILSVL